MKNTTPPERAAAVLAWLRSLKNDRGAMASLRCALIPARRHRAWPLLGRIGGIADPVVETIAGLYAFHPEKESDRPTCNLGDTCRLIADASRRGDGTSTFDGRFMRLLNCSQTELRDQLRSVVFAAKAKGVPVNYTALFRDLRFWEANDWGRTSWAKAYWGRVETEEEPTPTPTEAS
jgi:CRISPR system Cascade subunit CasB